MSDVQKITADLSKIPCAFGTREHAERVETGVLEINDDWPGIFIRGDNALAYAMYVSQAIAVLEKMEDKEQMDVFALYGLKGLASLLSSCRV